MGKMKCFSCGQEIDGLFVTTPHRVVGKDIDVIGGPKETFHLDCAGRKIFELRGHMSGLLNQRAPQGAVQARFLVWFSDWLDQLRRIVWNAAVKVDKDVDPGSVFNADYPEKAF